MNDLLAILDLYDRVVAVADGVAPQEAVDRAAAIGQRVRRRRSLLGETVVVALAGGTGSGKSSLLNAIADEEVAAAGARRPTTSTALAWIPSNPEPGLVRLLDALDISGRVGQTTNPRLAVIDLPDIDSIVEAHRTMVEQLVPVVDAVVWVVDPEKYQDRLLHERHLAPFSDHADRFLFALNQVDRLSGEERRAIVADLRRSLEVDGFSDAVIVETAADPPVGPRIGIEELLAAIDRLGEASQLARQSAIRDLAEAADDLASAAGAGASSGFGEVWPAAVDQASSVASSTSLAATRRALRRRLLTHARKSAALLGGRPAPDVGGLVVEVDPAGLRAAGDRLTDAVDTIAQNLDGSGARQVRMVELEIPETMQEAMSVAAEMGSVPIPAAPGWWSAMRFVRWLAVGAILVGGGFAADAVRSEGAVAPWLVVLLAGVVGWAAAGWTLARSAAGLADGAVESHRAVLEAEVRREIERRLGNRVRAALRGRAGLGAAHTEFRLALDRLE